MPKGSRCPSCGGLTFHQEKGVCKCSISKCKAIGWINEPKKPGGGKGAKCNLCGENTVRKIYDGAKVRVHHCFNCKATYLHEK